MQKGDDKKIKATAAALSGLESIRDFKYHRMAGHDVVRQLGSDWGQGLSAQEGEKRVAEHGANELDQEEDTPLWERIKE